MNTAGGLGAAAQTGFSMVELAVVLVLLGLLLLLHCCSAGPGWLMQRALSGAAT